MSFQLSMRIAVSILILSLLFASCRKEEVIVPGNVPPPDQTFTNTEIENYINKVYISLLGREADSVEFMQALALLKQNQMATADRETFINQVMADTGYYRHHFQIMNADLLNESDTSQFSQFIYVFDLLLSDSSNLPFFGTLQYEKDRLLQFQQTANAFAVGNAEITEMQQAFINNYFYDQINMGSLNFVVSVFQHFLLRYPSGNELNAGISMVDGNSAVLFLQLGANKDDFIKIFFSTDDYAEGQVRQLFLRYLLREPQSQELSELTTVFAVTNDYKQMQRTILMMNEFIYL